MLEAQTREILERERLLFRGGNEAETSRLRGALGKEKQEKNFKGSFWMNVEQAREGQQMPWLYQE